MASQDSVVVEINDLSILKADMGNTMGPDADPLVAKRNILKCLMGSNRIRASFVSLLPSATEENYIDEGYPMCLDAFHYSTETHHIAMTQALTTRHNRGTTPHQPDSVRETCKLIQQQIDNFPADIEDAERLRDALYFLKQENIDNLKHIEDQYELIEEFALCNFDEDAPIHNILSHCIETIHLINNTIYNFYTLVFNIYDTLATM
jgi:hypothetical protein